MAIPDEIQKYMKCSFDNDNHIVNQAILLPCGGNVCKKCIIDSLSSSLKCYYCNESHNKDKLLKLMPENPIIDEMIKNSYFGELVENLKTRFSKTIESIQGIFI
jgi:hypothetical protein